MLRMEAFTQESLCQFAALSFALELFISQIVIAELL